MKLLQTLFVAALCRLPFVLLAPACAFEKGQQVGELLLGQLGVNALRHERYRRWLLLEDVFVFESDLGRGCQS